MEIDYKSILSSEAVKELQESFEWYEVRCEGLGIQFIEHIDKTIRLIRKNPETFPVKGGSYREVVINKFPFVIIYELLKNDHIVYILHIFHTKRNPKQKYRRK